MLQYDKNGNILHLQRYGLKADGSAIDKIDELDYLYAPTSNRLVQVTDAGDAAGFSDVTPENGIDYGYDHNGNMTSDYNKDIESIKYNLLNLPTEIIYRGGNPQTSSNPKVIRFVYDAMGTKIEKRVTQRKIRNGVPQTISTTVTQYAGGYIYEGGTLQYFSHAEGYIAYDDGNFKYIYQYKDNLGNVRISYAKGDAGLVIVAENNYYAFGLEHKGYGFPVNPAAGSPKAAQLRYNGKELQEDLQLNWYDYGARNYDAAIGRWMSIDPLAETSRRWSPYNYCYNNPVIFTDPDGMEAQSSSGSQSLDNGDFEGYVSTGYMGMGGSTAFSQVNGAISFMGGMTGLSQSGMRKFDLAATQDAIVSNILTALWAAHTGTAFGGPGTLLSRFKKDDNGNYIVEPSGKPDFSDDGVKKINSSVIGLEKSYRQARKPKIEFVTKGDVGDSTNQGIIYLNITKILSNYSYASVLFHEYRHQWQFVPFHNGVSHYEYWLGIYGAGWAGSGGVHARREIDSYLYQQAMGDNSSYIIEAIKRYEFLLGDKAKLIQK